MTPVAQRKRRETRWQARGAAHSQHVCALSPSAVDEDAEEDGHTVVATARGVFSSNGGVLSSIETGVSIIIPQGAIPDGVEQEIYFKVCRDNSILPPLDKEKGSRPRCPARLPPSTLPPSAVGVARAARPSPRCASLLVQLRDRGRPSPRAVPPPVCRAVLAALGTLVLESVTLHL